MGGIDLIAQKCSNSGDNYQAVQCKFRSDSWDLATRTKRAKTTLSWNELSTFKALASCTGPYEKHVVMTNADFVKRMGHKTAIDKSYCRQKFLKMTTFDFAKLIESKVTDGNQSNTEKISKSNDTISSLTRLEDPNTS